MGEGNTAQELNKKIAGQLQQLLETEHKTSLSLDELLATFPEAAESAEQFEEICLLLEQAGIEVHTPLDQVDQKEASLPGPDSVEPISLYLHEIGRYPLLTATEERDLAQQWEQGRFAQHRLEIPDGDGEGIDREALVQEWESGKMARERLIKANFRLVIGIAKRYRGLGIPFMDLIQEGNLGLMKAVDKFDYRRGYRFSTYATWWIRQAIGRAVIDYGRTIRLPVHLNERLRSLKRLSRRLEQELGREATPEELAAEAGISLKKVQQFLQLAQRPLSLEEPVGGEQESHLGELVEDANSPSPVEVATHRLLRQRVQEALDSLSPRESHVLQLRFGLQDGRSYTLEEVGRKFGITRERVRQIEKKALRKLRHVNHRRSLKDYLH